MMYKVMRFVFILILMVISVLAGVTIGKADAPIFGYVISADTNLRDSLDMLPPADYLWSYRGFYDYETATGVETIPYYMHGTFQPRTIPYCPETMLVFHSPNARRPIGHPIVEQDTVGRWTINSPSSAVTKLLEVEQQCPNTRLVVGNVSPHNYCMQNSGSFCGTGGEWLDVFLSIYEQRTQTDFPHAIGVILSENTHADEYPISTQLDDYITVKNEHGISEMWVTFFNLKYGSYGEWIDSLSTVRDSGEVDALFVYTPVQEAHLPDCYRSLICNGKLTAAGQAVNNYSVKK